MNKTPHFRYEVIAEDLRQTILNGERVVGGKLPTEPLLAQTYGVTTVTLRKALALLEAEGILSRQVGRGTFVQATPKPDLAAAGDVVLYIGRTQGHMKQEFFNALVGAAQAVGRSVYPFNPEDEHGAEAGDSVARLLAAGAPLVAEQPLLEAWHARFPNAPRLPVSVILHGEGWQLPPGYHVCCDLLRAGLLATRHLTALGHRRIAFIGAHPQEEREGRTAEHALAPVKLSNPAYKGFRMGLEAAGVREHHSLGYYDAGVDAHGVEIDRRFLDRVGGWATAYVCDADFRAVTLRLALLERGLSVPRDVSVIGMGNTAWCHVGGALDSIDLAVGEVASLALSLAGQPSPAEPLIYHVHPRLVSRSSCAKPPRSPKAADVCGRTVKPKQMPHHSKESMP